MGKAGKLGKLMRKWQSAGKLGRTSSSSIAADNLPDTVVDQDVPRGLTAVFVGKSRRRYVVSSHLVDHLLFKELLHKSSGDDGAVTVGCEVVLFDHLLWMLENADPQPESLDDLLQFYEC